MKSNNFLKFSKLNLFKLLIEFSSSIDCYFILLICIDRIRELLFILMIANAYIHCTPYYINEMNALNNMNFIQYCM